MACKLKNIILRYLRFSQRCCWGFRLSRRWHCCVEWVVGGISEDHVAFMFLDCLPLKVKMTWYYKTSETTHPVAQHHIPGHLNPWVKIRASRTSKTVLYWFVAKKVLRLPNKTTWIQVWVQGGSNVTGTDLCVNKPHCTAAVRPWESEATTSTLRPARVRTCSVLSGSC